MRTAARNAQASGPGRAIVNNYASVQNNGDLNPYANTDELDKPAPGAPKAVAMSLYASVGDGTEVTGVSETDVRCRCQGVVPLCR